MSSELILAESKYVRTSPRKVAIVLDMVRGKDYAEAERILSFTNKKAAKLILKTLKSAGANAKNNKSLNLKEVMVAEAFVGGGPMIKRARVSGRSRTSPILKRTSHIKIGLRKKE